MIDTCPCKDCVAPKRYLGCHSKCKDYIDWNTARTQERAKIYQMNRADDDCFPNHLRNGRKRRRK